MNNVKFYKNPKRSEKVVPTKYVPQYQVLGVDPDEYKSSVVPSIVPSLKTSSPYNPRIRPPINQPYADATDSPVGKGPVPNIGNNMDHTWSSVDDQIIDDINQEYPTSPDNLIVDNNEYVSLEAFNLKSNEILPSSTFADVNEDEIIPILNDLESGSFLLLVKGVPICSGPASEIEEQVKALIFGDHELSGGISIAEEDLIVLKRVSIKVGVFLE